MTVGGPWWWLGMSVRPESYSETMATQAVAVWSRFGIKTARLCGCPEGLKSEAELVCECVCVYVRSTGLTSSLCVFVCVTSCSLLYASSVVFADGLTGSCTWDGIKHLSELCTGLHRSIPEQMGNAGERSPFTSHLFFLGDLGKKRKKTRGAELLSPASCKEINYGNSVDATVTPPPPTHSLEGTAASYTVAMVAIWIAPTSS